MPPYQCSRQARRRGIQNFGIASLERERDVCTQMWATDLLELKPFRVQDGLSPSDPREDRELGANARGQKTEAWDQPGPPDDNTSVSSSKRARSPGASGSISTTLAIRSSSKLWISI